MSNPVSTRTPSLAEFGRALLHDGVAIMTGSLSLILAFLAAYFDVAHQNIALLWIAAFVAISIAAYRVWAKERMAVLAEQAKNTKPLIVGTIIEVITEETISPDQRPFDYHFTVNFSLTNERADTNFQSFGFTLFAENTKNGPEHNGERVSLDGLCLERKRPPAHEKLKDFESKTLLTQWETRQGWLQFVVRGLQWDYAKSAPLFTRIQILVTDGSGQTWTLDSASSSWVGTNYELKIEPCNQFAFA